MLDGIFNMVGSTVQGAFNVGAAQIQADSAEEIAKMQVESNEKIAQLQLEGVEKQIAAQKEANLQEQEYNKQESELAYSRSSFAGQLKQLKDAGLSDQQARQYLLGSNAGAYTPAAAVNQMQGVDLSKPNEVLAQQQQANQQALAQQMQSQASAHSFMLEASGQVIAAGLNDLVDSYVDPNGGNLGSIVAAPFMREFSSLLSKVDKTKVHNITDLEEWINSLDPNSDTGKLFLKFRSSKAFKHLKNFAPAIKAANSFMNDIYTANLNSKQMFVKSASEIALNTANVALTATAESLNRKHEEDINSMISLRGEQALVFKQQRLSEIENTQLIAQKVLGEKYDALCKKLDYERHEAVFDVQTDAEKATFMLQFKEATINAIKYNDPSFIDEFVDMQKQDIKGQYALMCVLECENGAKLKLMKDDPNFMPYIQCHQYMQNAGLQNGVFSNTLQGIKNHMRNRFNTNMGFDY